MGGRRQAADGGAGRRTALLRGAGRGPGGGREFADRAGRHQGPGRARLHGRGRARQEPGADPRGLQPVDGLRDARPSTGRRTGRYRPSRRRRTARGRCGGHRRQPGDRVHPLRAGGQGVRAPVGRSRTITVPVEEDQSYRIPVTASAGPRRRSSPGCWTAPPRARSVSGRPRGSSLSPRRPRSAAGDGAGDADGSRGPGGDRGEQHLADRGDRRGAWSSSAWWRRARRSAGARRTAANSREHRPGPDRLRVTHATCRRRREQPAGRPVSDSPAPSRVRGPAPTPFRPRGSRAARWIAVCPCGEPAPTSDFDTY